jgi:RHS repeat-associated protein
LVLASNVYTRTLKDGTKINFNSSGYQTSIVDTNNNTLTFGYNGSNLLTTITDFNNLVTTLAYNASNKLSTITDPASRVTTLAYDAGNTKLISITDPDSALWQYSYDSANRLTTLTDPRSKVTTYAYSTGRVTTVTRADNSTALLTALQLQGIPASGTGTQSNPATPVLAAGATAAYTDPTNNIWNTRMDWLGLGEPTQSADPLGDLANTYVDPNGFPYVVADELSRRTRYFFDTLENPTKTVFADDNYQQATYNGFSEPLTITDELGNVTTYGYDTNGNNTQITDALSHTTTMAYTTHGFLSTLTDPNSHTTTYGYDTRSRETSIIDALLHTATMAYDSASNMTGQTDMRGNATTYTFDNEGRLLTTTLPGSPTSTTTNTYDAAGNLITTTDALGHVSTMAYDNLNREISSTDPLSHTTTYGYDEVGDQTTVTDPLSHITTYAFDAANRLTVVTDPNSHTTTYGLDAAGQRTSLTDALSHVTTYAYTNRAWLSGTTDPNSNVVNNTYNASGDLTSVKWTDASGQLIPITPEITTYTYDNAHRQNTMVDPLGNTTTYGFDPANNQTTVTDPLGHITTSTFDADNRLSTVTDALSHTVTYGYDNNGNRTTATDGLGRVTTYGYDAQNRLTSVTDPLLGVTTYAYDVASRQISLTDSVGNTTTYSYDNANRLITVTDPNLHTTTYAYDNANRLTSVTDRNGRQITYSYDSAGNKTGETWVLGSYIATYTYDAANRLTVEQDNFSKYTLGYDNANRLTSVDNLGTPNAPRLTLTYAYDHFGNTTNLSDNLNGNVAYYYDGDNHLFKAQMAIQGQAPKPTVTLTYDNASRLTSIVRGQITLTNATITTTLGYDNADRLTGITHTSSAAGTLMTLTYGYDAANQLTSYSGPEGTLTYTYDNDGQLTNVGNARTETYTYDKEGNRTMTGYTTTIGNRLTADGTYTYSYDNDGNMVGRTRTSDSQVTTFTYDYHNRLTEELIKTSGGTTVQDDKFTYDVENRRIGKNTLSGGQSWTGYDGDNPYADFNSSGSLTYRYLYGDAIDFLISRVDTSGVPMWYLTDNLGSVREDVNTSGSILDSITYDSYGNILSESSPSSGDRFKFTRREWDSEIGLYYYRSRYYSPTDGRFISEDPLSSAAGDLNLFRYVRNQPVNLLDPLGLDAITFNLVSPRRVLKRKNFFTVTADMNAHFDKKGNPTGKPDVEGFGSETTAQFAASLGLTPGRPKPGQKPGAPVVVSTTIDLGAFVDITKKDSGIDANGVAEGTVEFDVLTGGSVTVQATWTQTKLGSQVQLQFINAETKHGKFKLSLKEVRRGQRLVTQFRAVAIYDGKVYGVDKWTDIDKASAQKGSIAPFGRLKTIDWNTAGLGPD